MRILIFQPVFSRVMQSYLLEWAEALSASDESHRLVLVGKLEGDSDALINEAQNIQWVDDAPVKGGWKEQRLDWPVLEKACQKKGSWAEVDVVIIAWEMEIMVSLRRALKAARQSELPIYFWSQDYAKADGIFAGTAYDSIGRRATGVMVTTKAIRHRLIEYNHFQEDRVYQLPILMPAMPEKLSQEEQHDLNKQYQWQGKDLLFTQVSEAWWEKESLLPGVSEFFEVIEEIHRENDRIRLLLYGPEALLEQLSQHFDAHGVSTCCELIRDQIKRDAAIHAMTAYIQPVKVGVELTTFFRLGKTCATHHRRSVHHPCIELLQEDRSGLIWQANNGTAVIKKAIDTLLYEHARRRELESEAKFMLERYPGKEEWVKAMMGVVGLSSD